ncbi:MAG: hypothetical protein ABIH34_07220 [Nanoarchaeota archaeon]
MQSLAETLKGTEQQFIANQEHPDQECLDHIAHAQYNLLESVRKSNPLLNEWLKGGESLDAYFTQAKSGQLAEEDQKHLYALIGETPVVDIKAEFEDVEPFPPMIGALIGVAGACQVQLKTVPEQLSRRKLLALLVGGAVFGGLSGHGFKCSWDSGNHQEAVMRAEENLAYLQTVAGKHYDLNN